MGLNDLPEKVKEYLLKHVPEDEAEVVMGAYTGLRDGWVGLFDGRVAKEGIEPHDEIDKMIRAALVPVARSGVKNVLSKFESAAMALCLGKIEDAGDVERWLIERVSDGAFFLSEYRAIKEWVDAKPGPDDPPWMVSFVNPATGEKTETERVFPLWGFECKAGLDSAVKTLAFYEKTLKERRLL